MNCTECGRQVVLLVCCPKEPNIRIQISSRIVNILTAIEAGKLPDTIQECCPLRRDDRFSFPTDRQPLHSQL